MTTWSGVPSGRSAFGVACGRRTVARLAGVSRWTVARVEQGRLNRVALPSMRAVAGVLDISIELAIRWQGAELDRVASSGHDTLHEAVARLLDERSDWIAVPELSYSIWGERGVIDVVAWNPASRTLLVIELKTEIVEVGRLIAQVDRYRRLALLIARDRGWSPARVAAWVIVADSRTNRRRLAEHRGVLRSAFPDDGRTARGWLRSPDQAVAVLSFLPDERARHLTRASDRNRRGRVPGAATEGGLEVGRPATRDGQGTGGRVVASIGPAP
jgi:hypothetical protein